MSEKLRPHLMINDAPKVSTREYEGGGATFHRPDYRAHAATLGKSAEQLRAIFAKMPQQTTPSRMYYRVELPENQSVLTTTGQQLEDALHVKLLASPKKNVGHVSTSREGFSMLVEQLERYAATPESVGKSKFAIVEEIGPIPAVEKVSQVLRDESNASAQSGEALITIFPDLTRNEQEVTKKNISEFLEKKGGKIVNTLDSDEGMILRVNLKPGIQEIDELADAFPMVQSIDPVEEVIENSSIAGDPLSTKIEVVANPGIAKVCIFDSGVVKNSSFLKDSIISHEEPLGPPFSEEHGTFVASRIIFGDTLRDQIAAEKLTPNVKVLSVCMTSHDGIGNRVPAKGEEFLKIIRDTVRRWHKEIKVYNLSMNLILAGTESGALVTDDSVGIVAAEIDKLSRDYDVLFVVTTGNIPISSKAPLPTESYPDYFKNEDSRICRPSEAMLAVTVGSITVNENSASMTGKHMPSPFTRRGPGFHEYRKPDIIAHGGNLTKSWKPFNDLSAVGISADGKNIAYGNGTSYAAPLVSRLAALLFAQIPGATVNLVRAMLIHYSTIPKTGWSEDDVIKLVGNGLVDDARLLASDRWDQSYLFQGKIDYRNILQLPFFVPKELVNRKGNDNLQVKVTIVFSPETSRVLKRGYCKSHLSTKIQKLNASGQHVDVPVGDSVDVINDKYSTIIRCDQTFSRGVDGGLWQLVIEHKSRWQLRNSETPFAAIVSIIDPKNDNSIDIHALIQAAVPNRYQAVTKVSERIRV